jgi:hypothetical protein
MVFMDDEENDDLEEADLAFITSILESFSQSESRSRRLTTRTKQSYGNPFYAEFQFPPEGMPTRDDAKQRVMPQKFNYNSTIKMPTPEEFSYFPAVEEEGTGEFLDKSDNEDESYSEDTDSENTTTISSIAEARKNSPFAAWQPFIPSNWLE